MSFSCEIHIVIISLWHVYPQNAGVYYIFIMILHHTFPSHHSVVPTAMTSIWPNWSVHHLCPTQATTGVLFLGCSHLWLAEHLIPPRKYSQIHLHSFLPEKWYKTRTYLQHNHFLFITFSNFEKFCLLFSVQIYIHCNTAVCLPTSANNCEPRCFRKSEYKIREA